MSTLVSYLKQISSKTLLLIGVPTVLGAGIYYYYNKYIKSNMALNPKNKLATVIDPNWRVTYAATIEEIWQLEIQDSCSAQVCCNSCGDSVASTCACAKKNLLMT